MPAVARAALGVERARELGRQAVPLPVDVAADEVADVGVAELLERARRERGAVAGRAVDDDRRGRGRGRPTRFATRGSRAARAARRGCGPRPTRRARARRRRRARRPRGGFARSRSRRSRTAPASEQVAVARHCFKKDSGCGRRSRTGREAIVGADVRPYARRPRRGRSSRPSRRLGHRRRRRAAAARSRSEAAAPPAARARRAAAARARPRARATTRGPARCAGRRTVSTAPAALAAADAIFRRYDSLPARLGAAFAAWPRRNARAPPGARRDRTRAARQAQLHLGLALYWSRRLDEA